MKVLLRTSDNQALACVKVLKAYCIPHDNELILENSEDYITVSGITQPLAESAIRVLYTDGKVDLSAYRCDI